MKSAKVFLLLPILIMAGHARADVDAVRGKLLHEQSCTKCHDSSVYSRPDKRINSLGALQGQVNRCTRPAGAEWDKQDIADVVEYLNRGFYHFK